MINDKTHKLSNLTKEQLRKLLKKREEKGLTRKETMPFAQRNANKLHGSNDYPLSKSQERMWFLQQLNPEGGLYNIPVYAHITLDKPIQISLLKESLNLIISRHEMLRTSFHRKETPVQTIHSSVSFSPEYTDFSSLKKEEQEMRVKEIAMNEVSRPIPLEKAPLLRFRIIKLSEKRYLFLYTVNHLITDGWSNALFLKEILGAYVSLSNNTAPKLPVVKYQFIDYVEWERQWLNSGEYEKAVNHWKKLFSPMPENLRLPLDFPRPSIPSGKGKMYSVSMCKSLTREINQFGKKHGFTSFHIFFTALNIMLYRYSGQNKIVTGVPVANRVKREFQNIFGLFLNTLPLITDIFPKDDFNAVLNRIKQKSSEAMPYQHLPFDRIIEELNVKRDMRLTPLFQVMFLFQNIPSLYSVGNILVEPYKIDSGFTKSDLNIWVEEYNDTFVVTCYGNTDIFTEEKIKRITTHFINLVSDLIKSPEKNISETDFLTEHEKKIVCPPQNDLKLSSGFVQAFNKAVLNYENNCAVEFYNKKLTYKELDRLSNNLANYILQKNPNNSPVAIILPRGIFYPVCMVAAMKAATPYVPLDYSFPENRMLEILGDSKAKLIITLSDFDKPKVLQNRETIFIDTDNVPANNQILPPPSTEDTAYIIYTSGTTGKPKGVAVLHESLMHYTLSVTQSIPFEKESRYALVSTLGADLGNTMIFPALVSGGTLVIVPEDILLSGDLMADYFNGNVIDYLKIVPSHVDVLLKSKKDFLPEKAIILGGEKLDIKTVANIKIRKKNLAVYNHYGPTEATIGVTLYKISGDETEIPIGKPLNHARLYVLNENKDILPPGVTGNLYIGGKALANGYYNDENLTKIKFINPPFTSETRLYNTGDRAKLDYDGNYIFKGRSDRQVKIRGNRVELSEIENVLINIGGVLDAVVFSPQKETFGQLWAAVVINSENFLESIKQILAKYLPSFMIPDRIFEVNNIPLTSNGKKDYQKLLTQIIAQQQKEPKHKKSGMTPLEKEISGIFTQVLKREPDDLEKSFFDLGGHSLSSVELLYKINHYFKTNHQLSFIFRYPSVKQLVQNLNNRKDLSGIVTLKRNESSKALFLIHPAGGNVFSYRYFADSFEKNINIFGIETMPGDMKYKSIEELAVKYLERLRSSGFKGEIIIGGWSMGALIAYQMAFLSKEKYTVVLIDQMAEAIQRHGYQKEEDKILLFARKVEHFIGYKTDITGESIKGKTKKEISALFLRNFIEAGLVPAQTSSESFYDFLETMIHHNDLAYKYIPDNYSGKVIVVKSENPLILDEVDYFYNNRPEDLLWGKYANQIKLISSPGDHVSMMRNPYVKTLVKLLSKEIF